MNILMLLLFISIVFLLLSLLGFLYSIHRDEPGEADRLALLPLLESAPVISQTPATPVAANPKEEI